MKFVDKIMRVMHAWCVFARCQVTWRQAGRELRPQKDRLQIRKHAVHTGQHTDRLSQTNKKASRPANTHTHIPPNELIDI